MTFPRNFLRSGSSQSLPNSRPVFLRTYRMLRNFGESEMLLRRGIVALPAERLGKTAARFLSCHRKKFVAEAKLAKTSKWNLFHQLLFRKDRMLANVQLSVLRYRVHTRRFFLHLFLIASYIVFGYCCYQLCRIWYIQYRVKQRLGEMQHGAELLSVINNLEIEARRQKGIPDEEGETVW